MRDKDREIAEAAQLGKANVDAMELTRRHCCHARIELVHGTSMLGAMVGLPIGLLEVRCEHAPPPRTQSHRALDLAVDFYAANCIGCPYRQATGEVPNLATVAADRAARKDALDTAAQRAADARLERYEARRRRRRQNLAAEPHVVRDLGDAIDRIDRPNPRSAALTADEERAERKVVDAAEGAPQLFAPVLVDSLLDLARDAADPTALRALEALVRSGGCAPRRAVEAACMVLAGHRSPEASRLLALLEPDLQPSDIAGILDQLIELASGDDDLPWRPPAVPSGLIAASRVDFTAVAARICEHLASDDEHTRETGADAAATLLALDATRVVAFGPALASSVRGADTGYAGYPDPTGAAQRALAEGWRVEPELTRRMVENAASRGNDEVRDQLARVPWFLQRFREPWDASPRATSEAVSFLVRRSTGDWGDAAADAAAEHLEVLARDLPDAVASHVTEILAAILSLCNPVEEAAAMSRSVPTAAALAPLERDIVRTRRHARRRRLAYAIGRSASADPGLVLSCVRTLFAATTGDDRYDTAVRTTMLQVLHEAVSSDTLADILPMLYTALLQKDPALRRGGIRLWDECLCAADTLPAQLNELALPLLIDSHVVVHSAMLDAIPRLRIPTDLASRLLPVVGGWVLTYAQQQPPEPYVLAKALTALFFLLPTIETSQTFSWGRVALAFVERCELFDRERLLISWCPSELRADQMWVRLALATAASPELVDRHDRGHEPLLTVFIDRPRLLEGVPLAAIEPLSAVHGAARPWRALEPVELLQAAGRWEDAATLARRIEAQQPPGEEGAPGRRLAGTVAAAAELACALTSDQPSAVYTAADRVRKAVADLDATVTDHEKSERLRFAVDGIVACLNAAQQLTSPIISDPTCAAVSLEQAAAMLIRTSPAHASGRQRQWVSRAWKIAALLLRYDAAVRAVDGDASSLLQAAQREAELLSAELAGADGVAAPDALVSFLLAVAEASNAGAAQRAWRLLGSVPAPVTLVGDRLLPRRIRGSDPPSEREERPRAVCVATMRGVPVTDVIVTRPNELYHLGMTVRLLAAPEWAERCVIEPVTTLGPEALTLPRYEFILNEDSRDAYGMCFSGEEPLRCAVEQPILGPPLDCPLQIRLVGGDREQRAEVSGCQRLLLRPFDPSRDALTDHAQTDARILEMYSRLNAPELDTEDARAFCRLFNACVRAAQTIMFEKTFRKGSNVSEREFHDELERLLEADPELDGRVSRRDAVAGGFDDLLHDDIIAELKVTHGAPLTVAACHRYIGQPAQYGVGRGSQLSVLVVLDHGHKEAPPGVIDNYIGWLNPRLHGLDDPRYPSLVGVLIINTNLPVPSHWSRSSARRSRESDGTRVPV